VTKSTPKKDRDLGQRFPYKTCTEIEENDEDEQGKNSAIKKNQQEVGKLKNDVGSQLGHTHLESKEQTRPITEILEREGRRERKSVKERRARTHRRQRHNPKSKISTFCCLYFVLIIINFIFYIVIIFLLSILSCNKNIQFHGKKNIF